MRLEIHGNANRLESVGTVCQKKYLLFWGQLILISIPVIIRFCALDAQIVDAAVIFRPWQ